MTRKKTRSATLEWFMGHSTPKPFPTLLFGFHVPPTKCYHSGRSRIIP
jgi:hypothetical protein